MRQRVAYQMFRKNHYEMQDCANGKNDQFEFENFIKSNLNKAYIHAYNCMQIYNSNHSFSNLQAEYVHAIK